MEGRDRLAELQALLSVSKRVLIGPHLVAGRFPADEIARHAQDARGFPERMALLKVVLFGNANVLHGDQAVLDDLERYLVLDLLYAKSRSRLVLDHKTLHLMVSDVLRPDNRKVAKWRVAYPLFLTVEDPAVAVLRCGSRHATGHARTHQRLGHAEATYLLPASHLRQPPLFLLFRSSKVDGAHGQPVVHTKERRDRCVDASHLHRDETIEQRASATASVTLESDTADVQLGELRQQFKRKGVFNPVLVDDGRDFFLQKHAQLVQRCELLRIQQFGYLVKVAVWSRELLGLPKFLCGRLHCCTCRGHGTAPRPCSV